MATSELALQKRKVKRPFSKIRTNGDVDSWLNVPNAENAKSSNKEDLDKLLKLAEELRDKRDFSLNQIKEIKSHHKRSLSYSLIPFAIGLAFVIFVQAFSSINPIFINTFSLIAILLGLGESTRLFLTIANIYKSSLNKLQMTASAEKRALREVLQILRETTDTVAEKENWSVLSRVEFNIRLSRFDLSDETDETKFSFFS